MISRTTSLMLSLTGRFSFFQEPSDPSDHIACPITIPNDPLRGRPRLIEVWRSSPKISEKRKGGFAERPWADFAAPFSVIVCCGNPRHWLVRQFGAILVSRSYRLVDFGSIRT
jgi:hypothetical protein